MPYQHITNTINIGFYSKLCYATKQYPSAVFKSHFTYMSRLIDIDMPALSLSLLIVGLKVEGNAEATIPKTTRNLLFTNN